MRLFQPDFAPALELVERIDPKYAPVWQCRPPAEQAALARYFLPHRSTKPLLAVTRPRVVKWYCPFADQRQFPTGHRYCINVYTGCSHGCVYCYAAGYLAMDPRPKADFRRLLLKDLADLEAFDVPPAPVHLSNSTDAFQDRQERLHRDTLFTLRQLRRYRHRFTTITLLTKNPGLLASEEYLDVLGKLHRPGAPLVVEVSLAFWRDSVARAFDPGGPGVHQRASALARLCGAGVTVVIRVSPTYPIGIDPPGGACPQTPEDMDAIAALAARIGAWRIVYTPAKIVRPRSGPLHPVMQEMLTLYRRLAGDRGVEFRAGAWRLPPPAAERYTARPLRRICRRRGVELVFCRNHLLATR